MTDVFLAGFESGFVDEALGQTITTHSGGTMPVVSSAQAYAGTQSMYNAVANSYISVPAHASMDFTTGFETELAVRFQTLSTGYEYPVVGQWDGGTLGTWYASYYHDGATSSMTMTIDTTNAGDSGVAIYTIQTMAALSSDVWYKLKWVVDGAAHEYWLDDVLVGTIVSSAVPPVTTQLLSVGNVPDFAFTGDFIGYIDSVRVTSYAVSDTDRTLTDGIAFDDATGSGSITLVTLADTIATAVTRVATRQTANTAADDLGVTSIVLAVQAAVQTLTDNLGLATQAGALAGLVIAETVGVLNIDEPSHRFNRELLDLTRLTSAIRRAFAQDLGDDLITSAAATASTAVYVVETLELQPTLAAAGIYARTAADTIRLADALGRFLGGDIVENIVLDFSTATQSMLNATLADTTGVAEVLTPVMVLRFVVDDTIAIEDDELLQALYSGIIDEHVELSAAYISPNGNFTTWAMNTRTAAVTEYDNYEFNSFGVIAGRPVGATSQGLYELTGDDDAGDAIIARIKSGFMQFGGTKLSRLKAAYLATRGDAQFVLRIETGEGALYNYAVSTRGMRSTKVHMGKGQRARYFSFELIGAGEDFDIDTLEFVPIVVQRRV